MIKYFIFLSCLCLFSCTVSQPYIKSIAEIEDLPSYLEQTPKAEEHPNAGADLLSAYTQVELNQNGTSTTRNSYRIKIFNERGRNFATISIPYREGYQEVKILFAHTIKGDGQIVPLIERDIHDVSEHAGYEFYTDIKAKKFTMPAVEDNCIIEYAYEIKNLKTILFPDYFTTFFCRNLFPIEKDVLEIVIPENIDLKFKKFHTDIMPEVSLENHKKKYVFINLKQKEIIPESRMPSLLDQSTFPQILIWTLDSWETISKWYVKLIQEQMITDKELEAFTKNLIKGEKTDEDKIDVIFNFVSQNIRYVAVLLGPHTHKPHPAHEIFQKRYGDCKDKTVLLLTMLKIAGIKAFPALVPANGKYFDETAPSLQAFNHVIAVALLKDKYFWLDATNETAAFNSPPFSIPIKVFLIYPDGSYRFLKTPDLDDHRDYCIQDMRYKIDSGGNAAIHFTYQYYGKSAESVRYFFKYSPPEQRKKFFERVGIEIDQLDVGSFTQTQKPFEITIRGNFKNVAQVLDEETMLLSNVVSYDTYKDITASMNRQYPIELNQSFFCWKKVLISFLLDLK